MAYRSRTIATATTTGNTCENRIGVRPAQLNFQSRVRLDALAPRGSREMPGRTARMARTPASRRGAVKLNVVIHQADEGGYWAEVPSIPGCATQGDTLEELLKNVREAVEGCLSVEVQDVPISKTDRIVEITV